MYTVYTTCLLRWQLIEPPFKKTVDIDVTEVIKPSQLMKLHIFLFKFKNQSAKIKDLQFFWASKNQMLYPKKAKFPKLVMTYFCLLYNLRIELRHSYPSNFWTNWQVPHLNIKSLA